MKIDGSFMDTAITVGMKRDGNCFGEICLARGSARIKFPFWMKRHAEQGWNMMTRGNGSDACCLF
jgi:hypothetical protein